jgi:hypothetical protein
MRQKLIRRLSAYWKMEAWNVLFVPLFAFLALRFLNDSVSICVILAMLGCAGLLIIGAAAWRLELAQLQGEDKLNERLQSCLGPSRPFGLVLAVVGGVAGVAEWVRDGTFTPSAVAALTMGALAVLEYVNYYVAQLQHFDHLTDFKRLITGKGFRKPHLARVTEEWSGRHRKRKKNST